jgi:hypothetical protein
LTSHAARGHKKKMRAGLVGFLGAFGVFAVAAWCGCSSSSSSTFEVPQPTRTPLTIELFELLHRRSTC